MERLQHSTRVKGFGDKYHYETIIESLPLASIQMPKITMAQLANALLQLHRYLGSNMNMRRLNKVGHTNAKLFGIQMPN